jgi:hypothetical protein
VRESRAMPGVSTYHARFGGVKAAYRRIGYVRGVNGHHKGVTPQGRPCGLSDTEMLDALRRLHKQRGYLSSKIIDANVSVPCASSYNKRFGGLLRVYALIGFRPDPLRCRKRRAIKPRHASDAAILDALRQLLRRRGKLSKRIIDESPEVPSHGTIDARFGGIRRVYELLEWVPSKT